MRVRRCAGLKNEGAEAGRSRFAVPRRNTSPAQPSPRRKMSYTVVQQRGKTDYIAWNEKKCLRRFTHGVQTVARTRKKEGN